MRDEVTGVVASDVERRAEELLALDEEVRRATDPTSPAVLVVGQHGVVGLDVRHREVVVGGQFGEDADVTDVDAAFEQRVADGRD